MISNIDKRMSVLILVLLTIALYAQTVGFNFVWDDKLMVFSGDVVANSAFKASDLTDIFIPGKVCRAVYTPLTPLYYKFLYAAFNGTPGIFHTFNVLFMCVLSIVIFIFTEKLTKNTLLSLAASSLYAMHPIHVEVVCWISAMGYILSSIFVFLSLVLFLDYIDSDKGSMRNLFFIFVLYLLAVFSQPLAVVAPLLMVAVWLYRYFEKDDKRAFYEESKKKHTAFFIFFLMLAAGGYVFLCISGNSTRLIAEELTIVEKLSILGGYVYRLFFYNENTVYALPPASGYVWLFAAAVIFLATSAVIFRSGFLYFCIIWSFFCILPYTNIIYTLDTPNCDRYLFLLSYAFCLALAKSVLKIKNQKIACSVLLAVLLYFAVGTVCYSAVWKNELSMWTYHQTKNSEKVNVYRNLLDCYYELGDVKHAVLTAEKLEEAVKCSKLDGYDFWVCKSEISSVRGEYSQALTCLERAILYKGHSQDSAAESSKLFFQGINLSYLSGDSKKFIKFYNGLLEIMPRPVLIQGIRNHKEKKYDEAIKYYRDYLSALPSFEAKWDVSRLVDIAYLQKSGKTPEEVDKILKETSKYSSLYMPYLQTDPQKAEKLMLELVKINPYFMPVNSHLGYFYSFQNNSVKSVYYFKKAYELDPSQKELLKFINEK